MSGPVLVETGEGIATITLHRPEARNAINVEMLGRLREAMAAADADDAVCDILLASEKAVFADTHARVGVMPGWGLSVLLPRMVGRGMARRMSLTGEFVDAHTAARRGLVTEVTAHDRLPGRAREVASAIAGNDREAVTALLASYRAIGDGEDAAHGAAKR